MGSGNRKYRKREKYIPKSKRQTGYIKEKKEAPKEKDVKKLIKLWEQNKNKD